MKHDFSPKKKILFLLNFWWVITLLAIIGGLFGYFVSRLRQPVYDGIATISTSINYMETGQMSEAEQDRAFEAVKAVLVSDLVRDRVIQRASSEKISLSISDFSKYFFLERKNTSFDLRVEAFNAEKAARLANIWSETGKEIIDQAIANSIAISSFEKLLTEIELCFTNLNDLDSQKTDCEYSKEIVANSTFTRIEPFVSAVEADHSGILPTFSVSISRIAKISDIPRINNRNYMIAAGAVIGFMLGLILIETGLLIKWVKPNAKSKNSI